jgi:hypothetical protein
LPLGVREPEFDEDEEIVDAEVVDVSHPSAVAADRTVASDAPLVRPALSHPASTTPGGLRAFWILSALGGAAAILWSTYLLFDGARMLVFLPPVYYGLWMGCRAISRATGRCEDGLRRTAALHIGNLMACDVVNFTIGGALFSLANSDGVRRLLRR